MDYIVLYRCNKHRTVKKIEQDLKREPEVEETEQKEQLVREASMKNEADRSNWPNLRSP